MYQIISAVISKYFQIEIANNNCSIERKIIDIAGRLANHVPTDPDTMLPDAVASIVQQISHYTLL